MPNHPTSPELLLLGDSLIAMGRWANYFPGKSVINHGVPGDTTDCVWYRLHRTLELKPKRIVLLIGINDLVQGRSVETTASLHYRLLVAIRQALPEAKLYVLSCLPVDKRPELPDSSKITSLNQFIEKAAKENGAVYVDAYSALASGEILNDEFDLGDGIHLNEKAYAKLAEILSSTW